jgi:hypothetical protein
MHENSVVTDTASLVSPLLSGLAYPARKWQVVAWAEFNGASALILEVFHEMPERSYDCLCQVVESLHRLRSLREQGCGHRRHPASCLQRPRLRPASTLLAS